MHDIRSIVDFLLAGEAATAIPAGFALLLVIIMVMILLARVVASLRAWTSYDSWTRRKLRHIARYADRPVPHAGEFLTQWEEFRATWRRQSLLVRIQWILEDVA